ncbi:MAG: type II secretion system secretin GspD [Pseudomonadota bacterium]
MTATRVLSSFATGALASLVLATSAMAQENCGAAVNYEDADIRSVVDEIAMRTNRKFVLDPRVQGRVTIKSSPDAGLCADEIWELFQTALRVNGFTATPINGGSYKIVPAQEGPRSAGPVGEGRAGDLVTQIIRLRHIDAREAAANLSQIINERGVVAPVRSGNALIIVDTSDNIERLKRILGQIDRDSTVYKTITLNNASATEVANVVRGLAQEISEESGGQGQRISVLAVEASNSVLIRAEPSIITRLTGVVAELDRIGETKSDLSVIYLNHADAEEMTALLRELANSQAGEAAGDGGGGVPGRRRASISFHKPTNSVIISGDADIQRTLQSVVSQLDVRRAQVLIEAIIVEISDTTARSIGVEYFLSGDSTNNTVPFTSVNFSSAQPSILAAAGQSLLGDDSDTGNFDTGDLALSAIGGLLATQGVGIGGVGTFGDTVFGGILTAIKSDTDSKILSTPFTTTLDNKPASLSVGQEIPITTGEQIGDDFSNAFRTVSREEVGVILEVTPQINEGGTVTLEITQEISSVDGPIIATSTDLITNKSRFTTTALVDDGDILIIGGLIDQTEQDFQDKVPLLGDIPFIGTAFKNTAQSRSTRNLMVFIRPTILRNRNESSLATRRKFDYIRARDVLYRGDPTSDLERLIDQVTGVGPAPNVARPGDNGDQ